MGMFTTLVTKCGKRYQFKVGNDRCDVFQITDTLPYEPEPHYPGEVYIGDGVYHGRCEMAPLFDRSQDITIIVRDSKFIDLLSGEVVGDAMAKLYCEYRLKAPDPNLWTAEQWAKKAIGEYQFSRLNYLDDAELAGVPEGEQAGYHVRRYTRRMLMEPGFLDQVLGRPSAPPPTFLEEQQERWDRYKLERTPSLDVPPPLPPEPNPTGPSFQEVMKDQRPQWGN